MKPFLFVLLAVMAAKSPAFSQSEDPILSARNLCPASHLENIPGTNGSVLECYVFKTTPGVGYQVEVSNDLTHWTTTDTVYGLGHEYVVTMREFAAAPPPAPGAPPSTPPSVPAKCVSVRMQPAAGTESGTVVAWPSLDNGSAVMVKIDGILHAGWASVPLYAGGFGDYEFFVWHPGTSIDPPAENPVLGPEDTAMLAALEESLPMMNTQVATSVERSRNAPPPAPSDPDAKRFWRIRVDAGIDTDSDGTPDWAEFQMAANNTGGMVAGVTGDAFNSDTNHDGIPDGLQIDSDGDGTPDAKDPAVSDATTFIPLAPLPRYAMFEIPGKAIQINDRGTVIFPTKVWRGGTLSDLPGGGTARGINDLDVILGTANRDENDPDGISQVIGKVCYWASPTTPYRTLEVIENGQTVFAYCHHDATIAHGPGSILSSTGKFIEHGFVDNPPADYQHLYGAYPTLWQIPSGNSPATRQASPSGSIYLNDPGLYWGLVNPYDPDKPQEIGSVRVPALLAPLPFAPLNVIPQALPKGGTQYIALPSIDDSHHGMAYVNGVWKVSETYANAIDIAADGTAIGRKNDASNAAPLLLNGKWTEINLAAPGVSNPWKDSTVKFLDTTAGGWILASRGGFPLLGIPGDEFSVMLPIRVDGVDPALSVPPLVPPADPPEYLNGGVDHTSMTALGGQGKVPEIWIMAPNSEIPNGGASNSVRFQSPLNDTSKLTLVSDADIGFTPEVLDKKDMEIEVRGKKTDSADFSVKLKLGGTLESLSVPVKIKAMKKRTVKVAVHKVFGIDGSGNQTVPANFPTKAALDGYLNEVYGRQTNTFFNCDCTYEEKGTAGTGIDFDFTNGTSDKWISHEIIDPEVQALIQNPKSVGNNATANIDIWVFGGGVRIADSQRSYYGYQIGAVFEGKILIDGDLLGNQSTPDNREKMLLDTFAHEIGHVMVGQGHADKGDCKSDLYWTGKFSNDLSSLQWDYADSRNKKRLMCADMPLDLNNPPKQLIKNEWDLIEAWLSEHVDSHLN